jgi:hypothetical protein
MRSRRPPRLPEGARGAKKKRFSERVVKTVKTVSTPVVLALFFDIDQ